MGFEVQGGNNEELRWDSEAAKFISSVMSLGLVFLWSSWPTGVSSRLNRKKRPSSSGLEPLNLRCMAWTPLQDPAGRPGLRGPRRAAASHRVRIRSDPGKVSNIQEAGFERESLMLTGDLLLARALVVIYKIDDIETWLYVANQEETIRDIANSVMRQLVGDYSLHELLTVKVESSRTRPWRPPRTRSG